MRILSVSTATPQLSVALNNDEQIISEKNEQDQRNHSEHLDPLIEEILAENSLKIKDIDRFAVAIGPGSYTGLRIGITTIKMLASVLNKEVVGISTIEAICRSVNDEEALIVGALDARNDNYFAGAYCSQAGEMVNVIPDGHYHIDELLKTVKDTLNESGLGKVIFVGNGIDKQDEKIKKSGINFQYGEDEQMVIHAGLIGQLAVSKVPVDPDQLLPRYLRRTQAEVDWHTKTGKDFEPDANYVEEV